MWVLPPCSSHLLIADLSLSFSAYYWQEVSATFCLSCLLLANTSYFVSLLPRMWVAPCLSFLLLNLFLISVPELPVCECPPTFLVLAACWPLMHCLCSPECECSLFVLFTICWLSLAVSPTLLTSLWVLPLVCLLSADLSCCLLLGCECCLLFCFNLVAACWPLFYNSAPQDVSTFSHLPR